MGKRLHLSNLRNDTVSHSRKGSEQGLKNTRPSYISSCAHGAGHALPTCSSIFSSDRFRAGSGRGLEQRDAMAVESVSRMILDEHEQGSERNESLVSQQRIASSQSRRVAALTHRQQSHPEQVPPNLDSQARFSSRLNAVRAMKLHHGMLRGRSAA